MAIVDREGCGHRSRFNRLLKMEGIQTQYRKCVRIEKRKITKKKKAFLLLLRFCAFLELIWSQPAPSLLLSLLSYYILFSPLYLVIYYCRIFGAIKRFLLVGLDYCLILCLSKEKL